MRTSAQFGNPDLVELGPVLHRLLAPVSALAIAFSAMPLGPEGVQLLDLILPPRLPVPLEPFGHCRSSVPNAPTARPFTRLIHQIIQMFMYCSLGGNLQ